MATLTRSAFGGGERGFTEQLGEGIRIARARSTEEREAGEPTEIRGMREYALAVPEPKVGTLDLDEFPYQREPLYSDEVAALEEVVIMKATQVGVTTAFWRWIARQVDLYAETGIYYFPTDLHVTQFADERVDPAIDASEYLRSRMTGVHNKHQKAIGLGTLYFRGLQSLTGVQSTPADALVFDEYDESDQTNIEHAERRLSGARAAGRVPRVRRIGRPTVPGYGIAKEWAGSDQRVWIVTCPKCETEQELTFADNLRWRTAARGKKVCRAGDDEYEVEKDVVEVWRACRECGKKLDPIERGKSSPIHEGRWVAQNPGPGRIRGYHITRFIVPWSDLRQIVIASRKTAGFARETFQNADLGLPFAAEDAKLDDFLIDRACGAGPSEMLLQYRGIYPVTMGVDVASERALNVRISEHRENARRALWIGTVEDDDGAKDPRHPTAKTAFEKVAEMMDEYRVHIAAIDSNPDRRSARGALVNPFPGRAFLVSYATARAGSQDEPEAITLDVDKRKVTVNRTEALDAMMDSIRSLTNLPPQTPPPGYKDQLKAPTRRVVEDKRGNIRREYVSTGADDYAHAEVYDLVASEIMAMLGIARSNAAVDEQPIENVVPEAAPRSLGADEYDPGFGSYGTGSE